MSICARMDAPRGGALGKRKDRDYFSPPPSSSSEQQKAPLPPLPRKPEQRNKPLQLSRFANKPTTMPPPPPPPPQGATSKLLAGYLAHEFLRFGTLLGERPPAPARKGYSAAARPAPALDPARRYAEASTLLMVAGGPHIPGVVNPTQLGRWLRIKE
ncbi:branchpoint-bridging protein-like [Lolium rigidum]|uniref:branchpoint-bridging protein-like n=1 Tax=Lolium rigidum TaxID=89674 RepID=UPI001F5C27AE|nr:branchpoint-bridging protein-like [Lolium rigidum]